MMRKWGHFFQMEKITPPAARGTGLFAARHRTSDAPRWRSRLALDLGEGQKQTRCIDSPVRRRGGAK
jgi:hypothetical protein